MKASALCTALALTTMTLTAGIANAVEFGIPSTPVGIYDFTAGYTPPPSENGVVGTRVAYYSADTIKDKDGNDAYAKGDNQALSVSASWFYNTGKTLFGARHSVGVILPYVSAEVDLGIDTPGGRIAVEDTTSTLGDLQVYPLMLQWINSRNLATTAQFYIQAPTGKFDKEDTVNIGTNHWTFAPAYGVTWVSDSGFEVSSWFELNFSTRNDATDYQNGIEYHHDFAVGQHFGPLIAGLGGYMYHQFSDDSGSGASDGYRSSALAIGPALTYAKPGMPFVSAHVYKEVDAKGHAEGVSSVIRLAFAI